MRSDAACLAHLMSLPEQALILNRKRDVLYSTGRLFLIVSSSLERAVCKEQSSFTSLHTRTSDLHPALTNNPFISPSCNFSLAGIKVLLDGWQTATLQLP